MAASKDQADRVKQKLQEKERQQQFVLRTRQRRQSIQQKKPFFMAANRLPRTSIERKELLQFQQDRIQTDQSISEEENNSA